MTNRIESVLELVGAGLMPVDEAERVIRKIVRAAQSHDRVAWRVVSGILQRSSERFIPPTIPSSLGGATPEVLM
ncbi:hypothetical protein KQH82_06510 [bacterium]|nr:hypothetical protein [bacterium]